jgi:hypothetical protein
MPTNRTTSGPVDISADPRWGYNPLTRRYIKRSGEIWRRLVKAGVVQDEEVASQLANGAGTKTKYIRGQNVVVQADRDAASRTVADVFDPAKLSNSQLQQIADHISELQLGPKSAQRTQRPAQSLTSKWQDLAAASTQSETNDTAADSASDDDEPPPRSAPIRIQRVPPGRNSAFNSRRR